MKALRTKLENEANETWKFAIKNALLIAACPIITIGVGMIISIPILIITIITGSDEPLIITRYLFMYFSGLFVFSVMFFKVILNFIDYYQEKYKG